MVFKKEENEMKTGDIVRIKEDCTITDNAGIWATYEKERNKNKTYDLKKGDLFCVQRVEHKKDYTSSYFTEITYKQVPFIIPKGIYYNLNDTVSFHNLAARRNLVGLSKEQLDLYVELLENKVIDEPIEEKNTWYDSSGEISYVIQEYVNILKENRDKYPLGIYVNIFTETEQGYYESCSCNLVRSITGRRLESEQELGERKEKALEAARKKSAIAKKVQLAKAAKEKELYEKLKNKFEQGEVNR